MFCNIYIHGGGFASGSGVIALGADGLAREQNVVLVIVNQRLNVFGYLYIGEFSARYPDSGNVGLLDLVLALQWVRDNIENFGGDAGNVTLVCESGRGAKISALMAMPWAHGPFEKAIVESGSALRVLHARTSSRDSEPDSLAARDIASRGKRGILLHPKFPRIFP